MRKFRRSELYILEDSPRGVNVDHTHLLRVKAINNSSSRARFGVLHDEQRQSSFPRPALDELDLGHGGNSQESILERNNEIRHAVRSGAGLTGFSQATPFSEAPNLAADVRRGLHATLAAEGA